MFPFVVVFIAVVASIIISVAKALNLKKRKDEEREREVRRKSSSIDPDTPPQFEHKTPKPNKPTSARRDPFPSYNVNPFDESVNYASSLSAAQLNEWMLDFAAAEKANAPRPYSTGVKPLFARYLYESGFNYRLLRKIRGYTPQNRLNASADIYKQRPQNFECGVANPAPSLPLPEGKLPPDAYVRQKSVTRELPKKNFKERRELYEGFYINKD